MTRLLSEALPAAFVLLLSSACNIDARLDLPGLDAEPTSSMDASAPADAANANEVDSGISPGLDGGAVVADAGSPHRPDASLPAGLDASAEPVDSGARPGHDAGSPDVGVPADGGGVGEVDSGTSLESDAGGSLFLNGMFVIGVYGPEPTVARFTAWKCFGVNTVVDVPGTYPVPDSDVTTFDNMAKQTGLYQIRQPFMGGSSPGSTADQKDLGNTSLLALAHVDEPNNYCGSATPVSTIKNEYQTWKAALPNVPVYTGFSGGDMSDISTESWGCSNQASTYPLPNGYLAFTDWASNDLYPVDFYNANGASKGMTGLDLTLMLRPIEQIRGWVPSMPQFVYIEASRISQQNIAISVTGAQLTAEIWQSVVKGVRGIIYFPEVVASDVGFRWDGSGDSFCNTSTCDVSTQTCPCNDQTYTQTCDDTSAADDPQGVHAAIVSQNAILNALGSVLQGAIDPAGTSLSASSPLLAGWRIDAGGARWFIVVNPSGSAVSNATLTLTGVSAASASVYGESRTVPVSGGAINDTFSAYQVHIYSAAN